MLKSLLDYSVYTNRKTLPFTSFFGVLITLIIYRELWFNLYGSRSSFNGISIDQTITYITLSMVISPLFPNSLINYVNYRIREGSIIFDIARPLHYGKLLFLQVIGQSLSALLTTSLPLFLLSVLVMKISLPSSLVVWGAFLVSLFLGFVIAFFLDFLFSLIGFWITEISGFFFFKWMVSDLLSGKFIPLWIFPLFLRGIVLVLPFSAMHYAALSILTGPEDIQTFLRVFSLQIIWVIVLFFASKLLYVNPGLKMNH